jgi:PNKP adenylyltransferase domain, ligase domain/PNKP adenylyltransferase domain, C-terminal region
VADGIAWWTELTGRGGEGMVVKPLDFILRGRRGLAQPAVKCRGREFLRIIYGPDYTADENISRLRNRGLGHKRSFALGEFALGVEGLERFVRKEPLRRFMSASSASWPWRASLWTRGCDKGQIDNDLALFAFSPQFQNHGIVKVFRQNSRFLFWKVFLHCPRVVLSFYRRNESLSTINHRTPVPGCSFRQRQTPGFVFSTKGKIRCTQKIKD